MSPITHEQKLVQKLLKKTREKMNLTQKELSEASGISIPTIQNIEAGKANPTFEVLKTLGETLGLQLQLEPRQMANKDFLSHLGLPYFLGSADESSITKQKINYSHTLFPHLKTELFILSSELNQKINKNERLTEAFHAILFALKIHFPSYFKKLGKNLKSSLPNTATGRVIKLTRIATTRLSEYL